jgi:hypothetical protein
MLSNAHSPQAHPPLESVCAGDDVLHPPLVPVRSRDVLEMTNEIAMINRLESPRHSGDINMSYTPIRIDAELERDVRDKARRENRFRLWLESFVPLRLYSEITYGRTSLEQQLRARPTAPDDAWVAGGYNFDKAFDILSVIQRELRLPNANLIPDDPLFVVLIANCTDDFPIASVRAGLKASLGIELSQEDFLQMLYDGNWTVGRFVGRVLAR